MSTKKEPSALANFLNSQKEYPVLAALAAGLYPLLFYYSTNFTLINSWQHLGYFMAMFLLFPVLLFVAAHAIFKIKPLVKWKKYLLPFLNIFFFFFFLKICLYAGIQKKITLGIFIVAILAAYFLHRYFKKFLVVQLLLAIVGVCTLLPVLIKQFNHDDSWKQQPDAITQVVLKHTPNIYFIQPDGYVNFSELNKGYYQIDNSSFKEFLKEENFTNYPNFRSNYASTLSSNSATFVMKHHYYNRGTDLSEGLDARDIIMADNPVLDILKNNGYTTYFLTEKPYLLLNRPTLGYDKSNFEYKEVPYISTGLQTEKEILPALQEYLKEENQPAFFFMELFNPGHIANSPAASKGKEEEKELWVQSLERSNIKLKEIISAIKRRDPQGLIIIMADHGGFVGMEYAQEYKTKSQDRDLIYSMFSAQLSIHWPEAIAPETDTVYKTPVNLFRKLFAHLSEDASYLQHLEADNSYMILENDAPKGVYQYLDKNGNVTFKKI